MISVRRLSAECVADVFELAANDAEQPLGPRENVAEIADLNQQLLELGDDLVLLEPGEPIQPHLEDGLRLDFRQPVTARRPIPTPRSPRPDAC